MGVGDQFLQIVKEKTEGAKTPSDSDDQLLPRPSR